MDKTQTLALEAMREKGAADAAALAGRAAAGEAEDRELLAKRSMIPTWRSRDFSQVPAGTPYKWKDMVYKLRQAHDASEHPDWTPDLSPALWAPVSGADETGTAESPITAARGMEYVCGRYYRDLEDGKVYLCCREGQGDGDTVVLQFLPHELVGQYFEAAA